MIPVYVKLESGPLAGSYYQVMKPKGAVPKLLRLGKVALELSAGAKVVAADAYGHADGEPDPQGVQEPTAPAAAPALDIEDDEQDEPKGKRR